ncbi:hypothetical protein R1sor_025040 [Riccia sorocarpa]|uniref:Uncharacterized protein n=1 Tax=Riccia sorocarpa TaxID=122646 RepID=A0ABD3G7E6_9MARC
MKFDKLKVFPEKFSNGSHDLTKTETRRSADCGELKALITDKIAPGEEPLIAGGEGGGGEDFNMPRAKCPPPSPGYNPTETPSYNPAPTPGYHPAPTPGYNPAPTPGYHPAPTPGYHPAPTPGYNPAPTPGYNPKQWRSGSPEYNRRKM